MAADTRPYRDQIKDKDGNVAILRDKFLMEQTSGTTMDSTSCFETLDKDDKIVKIPKDDMLAVLIEAAGTLLSGSDKAITGADVTKIVALNNAQLGACTVAELKSALGLTAENYRKIPRQAVYVGGYPESFASYTTAGLWHIASAAGTQDYPASKYDSYLLDVKTSLSVVVQEATVISNGQGNLNRKFRRTSADSGTTFSTWKEE